MDEKNVVDVSPFLLFEATGDSEADSELNLEADMDVVAAEYDDDDAQSCSCDLLDHCGPYFDDDDDLGHTHDQDLHFDDDDDDDHDHDHEGEVIDQDWSDDDDGEVGQRINNDKAGLHKKSRACVDSKMELMNEMEKNRLFWEACLAS